jgi:hypothetical protein
VSQNERGRGDSPGARTIIRDNGQINGTTLLGRQRAIQRGIDECFLRLESDPPQAQHDVMRHEIGELRDLLNAVVDKLNELVGVVNERAT